MNTIAPYYLTQQLSSALDQDSRVVNLSSAAQAPVDPEALAGNVSLDHQEAYAQSKLALTMWSMHLGLDKAESDPMMVAVNPGSLLATKMVKEGFGIDGSDIGIGATIRPRLRLMRASPTHPEPTLTTMLAVSLIRTRTRLTLRSASKLSTRLAQSSSNSFPTQRPKHLSGGWRPEVPEPVVRILEP